MVARAAVVIGVARTGGLPHLRAAVPGAEQVALWLESDGYAVKRVSDDRGRVAVAAIKEAVRHFVDLGTVRQLVIYFAGHGYLNGTSEIWLLSGAPDDAGEAVDQTISAEHARLCGIPSVTFVSDCCRSEPASVRDARVTGTSIFPNRSDGTVDVEVDRLFATRPGDPALEMSSSDASNSYEGLFTSVWQDMHRDPPDELRRSVTFAGESLVVVPNRALKRVLPERVDAIAQRRSIRLTQKPEFRLEGGETSFVAQATNSITAPSVAPPGSRWWTAPSVMPQLQRSDQARSGAVRESGRSVTFGRGAELPGLSDAVLSAFDEGAFAEDVRSLVLVEERVDRTAEVSVSGDHPVRAWALDQGRGLLEPVTVPFLKPADKPKASHPRALLIQMSSGIATMVATMPGWTACIVVSDRRIVHVAYLATDDAMSPLWRATAAVAARRGVLASDRAEAEELSRVVRSRPSIDPTACLYAAMTLADLGASAELTRLTEHARRRLGFDLFDLALLAGQLGLTPDGHAPSLVLPSCPMLGASWSYLKARGVSLSAATLAASLSRRPALWTTFDREGLAGVLRGSADGVTP